MEAAESAGKKYQEYWVCYVEISVQEKENSLHVKGFCAEAVTKITIMIIYRRGGNVRGRLGGGGRKEVQDGKKWRSFDNKFLV